MPKPTKQTPTTTAPTAISALPPKRGRRRSTRGSQAWRFRRPPSRKRVAVATARGPLPETVLAPIQPPELQPANESCN